MPCNIFISVCGNTLKHTDATCFVHFAMQGAELRGAFSATAIRAGGVRGFKGSMQISDEIQLEKEQ